MTGRSDLPDPLPFDFSTESTDRDLAMSRWLRDWRWSQRFAPPPPLVIVTGI